MDQLVPIVFWIFVMVAVLAGVWKDIATRRDTQLTIRLAIEKGQSLDPALVEKLLRPGNPAAAGALVGGAVLVAVGLGLPSLGAMLSLGGRPGAVYPLTGAGVLVLLVGVALLLVWRFQRQSQLAADARPENLQ
jgi:hypothetical protein